MQFAAGQLTNALGIQTACHLEQCQQCRQKIATYEQLGGELLDFSKPVGLSAGLKDKLLAKIRSPEAKTASIEELNYDPRIPRPLQRFVPQYYEHLPWSGLSKSIQSYDLPFSDNKFTARFYKISAGKELPQHTHKGNEYTLVLSGSFSDLAGDYHPGDFVLADTSTHHQPRAHDKEDCICFAVMDAPLKLTGLFGRLLNPFIR